MVLSSSVMFIRMGVLVTVVAPPLLRAAWLPLAAMAAAGLLVSLWLYRRSRETAKADLKLSNPVELWEALKFALYFTVVLVGSKAAATYLGTGGAYAAGAIAGTADVDAITLSMARLARNGLAAKVAVTSIFLAAASNTVVKAVLSASLGGWTYGRRIASAFAIILAAGGAAVLWGR